jgi:hypothetical protein
LEKEPCRVVENDGMHDYCIIDSLVSRYFGSCFEPFWHYD